MLTKGPIVCFLNRTKCLALWRKQYILLIDSDWKIKTSPRVSKRATVAIPWPASDIK